MDDTFQGFDFIMSLIYACPQVTPDKNTTVTFFFLTAVRNFCVKFSFTMLRFHCVTWKFFISINIKANIKTFKPIFLKRKGKMSQSKSLKIHSNFRSFENTIVRC